MENIGQKIKKIRELRNFSRHYVASQLVISITTYGKIERNELDITLKRLYQISRILDVSMSAIIDFDENSLFNSKVK
jgi:transcriptional regulator with XRE-family HTH domain